MLLRFPNEADGQQILKVDNHHYALLKQRTRASKRTIFLQENTLVFVIEGHKMLHFENHNIKVNSGSLLFLKRGFYVMSDFVDDGLVFQSLLIYFTDEQIRKFLIKFNYTEAVSQSTDSYLSIPISNGLEDFRLHYIKYFNQNINTLSSILQLKLNELFLLLMATPQQQQILAYLQQIAFQQPADISYLVKQYLFQPLSLPELAKLSGRSLASFKRDFVHQFNKAPGKWINEQRLMHARMLLRQTNKQVAEIAYECGYNNIPHFIKSYKQNFGITPNQDRAN
ncbi:helix-turn-helix domain-containing protein [Chitinophaga silvatica]|uniref:Helix-turn-helix domain-containing protein n=1 Tax=Chitinophaga silvatica TaxID=2282649 RepID=A0A3E1YDM4_9BACT|nr:helix-turn-helix domain-containing protein [Chitinophaga silvatica]RFS24636.1 helix-turn-helix domain-containing protein [Chitinophaga silvatica]